MRIIHLSDVHYSSDQSNFNQNILEPLINDLKEQNEEKRIELICFTGDMIDKGGHPNEIDFIFREFENNFINPILNELKMDKDRFLFVPGNHDIERKKIIPPFELGLKTTLINVDKIEEDMKTPENLHMERIDKYKSFEKNFYNNFENYKKNSFGYSFCFEKNNNRIAIAGINSSWRCSGDDDKGNLIVGRKQLEDIKHNFTEEDYDLKIALMHHPFEYLVSCEKNEVEESIIRDYDLLLTGHNHSANTFNTRKSYGNSLILSQASSNWEVNRNITNTAFNNGYTIIDFFKEEEKLNFKYRIFNWTKEIFVADNNMGEGDSAEATFFLEKNTNREWIDFFTNIKSKMIEFSDDTQKSMVSYGTNSTASSNIDDIFVSPDIVIGQDIEEKDISIKEKKKKLDLESLINYEKSLILFGPKEIGKTTLLYKNFKYYLDNSIKQKKIPVYIDMRTAENKLEKEISGFLGLSVTKTKENLRKYNFVLLLDNIKFDESKKSQEYIKQLNSLLEEYPKLKIIGTSTSYGDQEQLQKVYDNNLSTNIDVANISYFGFGEIKTLMSKWLGNNHIEDKSLDDLVQNFHNLNIPSTPLSVSLFLWIYEKQKNFRPINNAALLNNFVEKLFEKHSEEDAYADEFDYVNKENILAAVSFKMLETNEKNYRLSKNVLNETISNVIKAKKMSTIKVDSRRSFSEWLIDYYEEKGILISESSGNGVIFYKFKLQCFMDFFLAKYMTLDNQFKNRVFSENYLLYEDEIDYYTGLNRHESFSLEFVYENMLTLFSKMIPDVDKNDEIKNIILEKELQFERYFNINDSRKSLIELMNLSETDNEKVDEVLDRNKSSKLEQRETENNALLKDSNDQYQKGEILKKHKLEEMSQVDKLQKAWVITAKVLKNTDEMLDGKYRLDAFQGVIFCSLLSLLLFHKNAETRISSLNEEESEIQEFYNFFVRFGILLHENVLYSVMGTNKLNAIVEEYLAQVYVPKNSKNDYKVVMKNVSDIELFFVVLFYSDNSGEYYKEYLKYVITNVRSNYIRDSMMLKLGSLHASCDKNSIKERDYKELINYLISKTGGEKYYEKAQKNASFQNNFGKKEVVDSMKEKMSK